jgi:hypothetical protein
MAATSATATTAKVVIRRTVGVTAVGDLSLDSRADAARLTKCALPLRLAKCRFGTTVSIVRSASHWLGRSGCSMVI